MSLKRRESSLWVFDLSGITGCPPQPEADPSEAVWRIREHERAFSSSAGQNVFDRGSV
jgi:hypothetical protein